MKKKYGHKYHIVGESPWPILTGIGIGGVGMWIARSVNTEEKSKEIIIVIIGIIGPIIMWRRDIRREATYKGKHTKEVSKIIREGVIWVIVSEVMIFVGIITTYQYSERSPTIWIGGTWPSEARESKTRIPMINTVCLVTSGATLTISHRKVEKGGRREGIRYMIWTIILGIWFIRLQTTEYRKSKMTIADGIEGSCFYIATGLHGIHVIIGVILLLWSMERIRRGEVTTRRNVGVITSTWYWHFVDVVWIMIYIMVYRI